MIATTRTLGVIGLALLEENETEDAIVKAVNGSNLSMVDSSKLSAEKESTTRESNNDDVFSSTLSIITVALAAAGAWWATANVGSTACSETVGVAPLVYDLLALGLVTAILPIIRNRNVMGLATTAASLVVLAGSAVPLAGGLGVPLPFPKVLNAFNSGAISYGLFAVMTGAQGGRPVAAIEAATSVDGPWSFVPLLYQTNDPSSPLPLCFPHFPRLDWTLWFVPLGETGPWIGRLLKGITVGDPSIMSLLDQHSFRQVFTEGPPEFVRLVPKLFTFDSSGGGWLVSDDPESAMRATGLFSKGDLLLDVSSSWPSLPFLRDIAGAGRPEHFVWGCLAATEVARRAFLSKKRK